MRYAIRLLPWAVMASCLLFSHRTAAAIVTVGDVDGDGIVTIRDAEFGLIGSLDPNRLSQDQRGLADMNDDGDLGLDDVILSLETAIGLIPPLTIDAPDAITVKTGDASAQFTIHAVAGGRAPSLTVGGLPAGAQFDPATGLFSWSPVGGPSGDYPLRLTVDIGAVRASRTILLRVLPGHVTAAVVGSAPPPGFGLASDLNADRFDPSAPIVLTFSGPIDPATFRVELRERSSATGEFDTPVVPVTVSWSTGWTVGTIKPAQPLESGRNSVYRLAIVGAESITGDPLAAGSLPGDALVFRTKDRTPPSVTLGCFELGALAPVVLQFDEPIDSSTFVTQGPTIDPLRATVFIYQVDPFDPSVPPTAGAAVPGSVRPYFTSDRRTVRLGPLAFASNARYRVRVLGMSDGSDGFPLRDQNGNVLPTSITVDLPEIRQGPWLTATVPMPGAGLDPNVPDAPAPSSPIILNFTTPMAPGSFKVELRVVGTGSDPTAWPIVGVMVTWDECALTATVKPIARLSANTVYQLKIVSAEGVGGGLVVESLLPDHALEFRTRGP